MSDMFMPTDEDIAAYMQAIIASPTAKTPAARLNFGQDWWRAVGLDPFASDYVEEPFPEEQFAPITRDIYATDPNSPYLSIFDAIDQGVDPVSAARTAIEQGVFGNPRDVRDDRLDEDIVRTARDYAGELKTFQQEQAKWQREQASKRAEAPVTLNELLFPRSQYEVISEAAGKPEGLTVDDMLSAYNRSRFEAGQAARQRGMAGRAVKEQAEMGPQRAAPSGKKGAGGLRGVFRAGARMLENVPGLSAVPQGRAAIAGLRAAGGTPMVAAVDAAGRRAGLVGGQSAGGKVAPAVIPQQRKVADYQVGSAGSVADLLYRDAARRASERQKQTPVWDPRAQQVMRNISLMQLLAGGQ